MNLDIDNETKERLINEALSFLTSDQVYEMALERVDKNILARWKENPPSAELVGKTFALAGFISGMSFTMENLVGIQEDNRDQEDQ